MMRSASRNGSFDRELLRPSHQSPYTSLMKTVRSSVNGCQMEDIDKLLRSPCNDGSIEDKTCLLVRNNGRVQ